MQLLNFLPSHFSGLSRMVNYHRHTNVSFKEIAEWLIKVKFLDRSLYRAPKTPTFTSQTARNMLNDTRINWQRLTCLLAKALIKYLKPFVDHQRRFAFFSMTRCFRESIQTRLNCWRGYLIMTSITILTVFER